MMLIMEDNGDQNTSILLSKILKVDFSCGNTKLIDQIKNNSCRDCIILIDVVPDNAETFKEYEKVFTFCKDVCVNCFVFPNICTEYAILKSLEYLGIDIKFKFAWMYSIWGETKLGNTIANKIPKKIGYKGNFNSFENQCKVLLNNAAEEFKPFSILLNNEDACNQSYYLSESRNLLYNDKAFAICKFFKAIVLKNGITYPNDFTPLVNLEDWQVECREKVFRWKQRHRKVLLNLHVNITT